MPNDSSGQGPERLAPCPFCGGVAAIERNYDDPSEMFVRCQGCGATVGSVFEDSPCADEDTPGPNAMLTAAWNRRVSLPDSGDAPRPEQQEKTI